MTVAELAREYLKAEKLDDFQRVDNARLELEKAIQAFLLEPFIENA